MDVLVVTPELAHYSGTSTLAESAGALAKSLRGLGHKVQVVSPLWAAIDPQARHLARRLVRLEVKAEPAPRTFALYEGRTTAGVDLAFLGETTLFDASAHVDDEGALGAARWGGFARAVVALLERRAQQGETLPGVVHILGWQCGVLPVLLSQSPLLAGIPTVFTVHDLSRKGSFDRGHLTELGLQPQHFAIDGVEFFGRVSTLKAGLLYSTRVLAPAPSLASRFVVEAGGAGLEGVLRARGDAFVGILDGVDTATWNPATDPHLDTRYDAMDGVLRSRNKSALQAWLGFPLREDVPLLVTWLRGRPDERAFHTMLPRLLKNDVQIVVFTAGEAHEDDADLARRYPDRLAVRANAVDEVGSLHRALGGVDLVLLPALEDPYALLALQAQRYGVLPIARAEGLVADAVVDADAQLRSGTGFTFSEASVEAFLGATLRAATAFQDRAAFHAMQRRAMLRDHAWDRTARLVERVYRAATA